MLDPDSFFCVVFLEMGTTSSGFLWKLNVWLEKCIELTNKNFNFENKCMIL